VVPIRVPPLRERPGDITLLTLRFLESSAQRCKKPVRAIAPAAMRALSRYSWPGNVRELQNVIERAVIVAKGDTILDVERFLTGTAERPRVDLSLQFHRAKARVVDEFERAYIAGVLEAHGQGGAGGQARRPRSEEPLGQGRSLWTAQKCRVRGSGACGGSSRRRCCCRQAPGTS